MASIGIVQGGIEKQGGTRMARRQYLSDEFESRRAYAVETCDVWVIVSPKHDIVRPEEEIAGYDLSREDFGPFEEMQWVKRLQQQMRDVLFDGDENPRFSHIVVLTDDYHNAALEPVYRQAETGGVTVEEPGEDTDDSTGKLLANAP